MDPQTTEASDAPEKRRGHIIVVGNEKGGSGKTTTCVHLVVALLRLGFRVGSMDIDARQRSLTRYLENRKSTMQQQSTSLPMPSHAIVNKALLTTEKTPRKMNAIVLPARWLSCLSPVILW